MPSLEMNANGWRLLAGKAFRAFGFGLNSVVLGLYLSSLELGPQVIGFVLSAALTGTVALTLVVTVWGDRIGRRRLLTVGSALMLLAAAIPFVGANPVVLVVIGLTGMVAVTSSESTGLQSIDQAMVPQTVRATQRTRAFALYNVVAVISAGMGALAVGPLVIIGEAIGLGGPARYAPAFALYAACGLASAAIVASLDHTVETKIRSQRRFAIHRSQRTVAGLAGLFAIDALAGAFIVQSYLAFWLSTRFAVDDGTVGIMFAAGSALAALSFPVAAWLASRIGLIPTMVFTHIPANIALIGMALAPALAPAIGLFLLWSALSSMDVPARQSYTMAVVDPDERTATAGVISLARGGAQTLGPAFAGSILVPIGIGVPLAAAGVVKTCYNLLLYAGYNKRRTPEEIQAIHQRFR